jgi:hypothetical protein
VGTGSGESRQPGDARAALARARDVVSICQWLLRDGLPLDRDTRIKQAITELGFKQRRSKIVQRINEALDSAERMATPEL